MASNKNITMKQFNGTDYDTLYPKTVAAQIDDVYSKSEVYSKAETYSQSQLYTQAQTLTNATKTLYGLNSSAVPNDAFATIKTMFDGRVRIAHGTYRGTGVYGVNNKNSLTFPFAPELLILYQVGNIGLMSGVDGNDSGFYAILPRETTAFKVVAYNSNYSQYDADTNYISFSGNTATWYIDYSYSSNAGAQFNASGTTYGYIVIGGGDY